MNETSDKEPKLLTDYLNLKMLKIQVMTSFCSSQLIFPTSLQQFKDIGSSYIAGYLYKAVLPLPTQSLNYPWKWPKFTRREQEAFALSAVSPVAPLYPFCCDLLS